MHFKGSAHPAIGIPCNTNGVRPFATAPNCYTPDVYQLKSMSTETMVMLSSFVSTCKPAQAKILMGLLKNQAQLKKYDLAFMQRVYFAIGQGNFLTEYFAGYVMGVAPQEKLLIVGSQYWSNTRNAVVAQLDRRSVIDREAFTKIVSRLKKAGKLAPPRVNPPVFHSDEAEKYEPPTIETAQELLEATAAPKKPSKNKGKSVLTIGGPAVEEV